MVFPRAVSSSGERWFWVAITGMAVTRFLLTSDINVQLLYLPHDSSLYLMRAFRLLLDQGFGPYDSRLLIKLPGISFWMAAVRWLGLPFVFSLNAMVVLAGTYFVAALRRLGFSHGAMLLAYAVYVFNPVSYDFFSLNIFRGSLDTSMFVMMASAMLFVLDGARAGKMPWRHLLAFSGLLGFVLLLREEGRLLFAWLALFVVSGAWHLWSGGRLRERGGKLFVAQLILLPLLLVFLENAVARGFIWKHYGVAILNDFGGGEFPKFIAALRSVRSDKSNPLVSISHDALEKIRVGVPSLRPLVSALPPPPGRDSPYAKRYGVADEWTNSHFMFWIKDSAFAIGATPDLPTAQAYFRDGRLKIERACQEGRLNCEADGGGLFPRFRMEWTPIFFREFLGAIGRMVHIDDALPRGPAPFTVEGVEHLLPLGEVMRLGRAFQTVTMSPYDSFLQWEERQTGGSRRSGSAGDYRKLQESLSYWLRYPDVAADAGLGIARHLTPALLSEIDALLAPILNGQRRDTTRDGKSGREAQYRALERLGLIDPWALKAWSGQPVELYLRLKVLLENPKLGARLETKSMAPEFGKAKYGALFHYKTYGRAEGRSWGSDALLLLPKEKYTALLAESRPLLESLYTGNLVMLILGAGFFVRRSFDWRRAIQSSFWWLTAICLTFFVGKALALAYLSVPMGTLDHRIYYSTYCVLVLLAGVFVGDGLGLLLSRECNGHEVGRNRQS